MLLLQLTVAAPTAVVAPLAWSACLEGTVHLASADPQASALQG
jgi:hypothetical protein